MILLVQAGAKNWNGMELELGFEFEFSAGATC
jgi:hypothetical protein